MISNLFSCTTDWQTLAESANFRPEEMAKQCGISQRTLRRVVRKKTGKTPQDLIKETRLLKGFDLLLQGLSVKAVAFELKYKQTPQFSREFNKFFGAPPRSVYELLQDNKTLTNLAA